MEKWFQDPDQGGPGQPLLIVNGLKKYFDAGGKFFGPKDKIHAVDNISFEIRKGETLGIVGESGCGKSTTSRLLLDLTRRDEGEIIFDGQALGANDGISVRALRKNAQMVFQDSFSSLNPRARIIDIVAFPLYAAGGARADAEKRAAYLLERVGLDVERFGGRYSHEISGGQRQRVNIARALATAPKLVILDEAVSALDKSVEAEVLQLLDELKRELALTYMFISHDLNVVRHISDRVMVMYLGEVAEIGDAEAIFEKPMHPYTRALLSAIPSLDPEHPTQVAPLEGDPPNPVNPAPGCRFRPRCAYAEDICSTKKPEAVDRGTQIVACHMCNPISGHSRSAEWMEQSVA